MEKKITEIRIYTEKYNKTLPKNLLDKGASRFLSADIKYDDESYIDNWKNFDNKKEYYNNFELIKDVSEKLGVKPSEVFTYVDEELLIYDKYWKEFDKRKPYYEDAIKTFKIENNLEYVATHQKKQIKNQVDKRIDSLIIEEEKKSDEEIMQEMEDWFRSNYENPENVEGLRWDSEDEKYDFIYGGPFEANVVLQSKFGEKYDEYLL